MRRTGFIAWMLDPGWLFVVAGLAVCSAGVLVPAQDDLAALRRQRDRMAEQVRIGDTRLEAHRQFLRDLERQDPQLMRRLAASQLNLVPAGTTPVLLASPRDDSVMDWINASVIPSAAPTDGAPAPTLLDRLTNGRYRLWVLAGGVLAIFVGLLMGPGGGRGSG